MTTYFTTLDSPVGTLLLAGNGQALTHLAMSDQKYFDGAQHYWQRDDAMFRAAREQLSAYFAGDLRVFDLILAPPGTPFQRRVWQALQTIPFGQTASYGTLASRIDAPQSSRAVGMANGRNPIPIIIPCHRIIGANGKLTGYSAGIERKRWLLEHEGWKVETSGQKVLFE